MLKDYVPKDEEDLLNQVDLLVQALMQNGTFYENDADYQKAFDSIFTAQGLLVTHFGEHKLLQKVEDSLLRLQPLVEE